MPFPPARYLSSPTAKSFLLRQIITTGYVICGYNSGSPWTNVNQVTHSTDTTIDMGNVMVNSTGYPGGLSDDTFAYAVKLNGGVGGSGTGVGQYNMRTNTCVSFTATPITVGNTGTFMHKEQTYAWATPFGGTTSTLLKFNFATKTWSTATASYGRTDGAGTGGSTIYGEFTGWNWGDGNSSSYSMKLVFATETQSSGAFFGNYGQQKGISSKVNFGYAGNEGDYAGGNNFRKWNFTTESIVSYPGKPIGNSGEENFDMGQDHQYMLGMYNGTQNNRSWRFNYSTDSGFEGSSTMQSKGVSGRSSAYSAQRS